MPDTDPQHESGTRERLVHAALQLFAEKGYGSTSVADVRQTAQAHSGSLYHFFPGKQELLLAVLDTYLEGIGPMLLAPAFHGVDDPIERIFALLQQYRQWLSPNGFAMGCPIGNLALELSDGYKDIRALIHLNFRNWVGVVKSWLDAAGDRLPANTNRQQLAQLRAYVDLLESTAKHRSESP